MKKSYTNYCPVIIGTPFIDETKDNIKAIAKIIKGPSYYEGDVALVTFELEFNNNTEATFDELSNLPYEISTINNLSSLYDLAFVGFNDDEQLYYRIGVDDKLFTNLVWEKINVLKFEPNELNSTLVRTMLLMSGALPRYIVNSVTDYSFFDGDSFVYKFDHKNKDLLLPLKRNVPEFHWQYVLNKVDIMSNNIVGENSTHMTKLEATKFSVQVCVQKYLENVYTIKATPLLAEQSLLNKINEHFECGSTKKLRLKMGNDITAIVNWV